MRLHSYHVDDQTIKAIESKCTRVQKELPGLSEGRGRVVLVPQITQRDLLRLSQMAFSGYVEVGGDADKVSQTINQSLQNSVNSITVCLTTRTFTAIDAAHVLIDQFEVGFALNPLKREKIITALHEGILRGIIYNLELCPWAKELSDLPIFFDMFYTRIADIGYGRRRITVVIDGDAENVSFTVAIDPAVRVEETDDEKRALIEAVADKVSISNNGQAITATFKNHN
ncbi:MAG: hypothetical protein IPP74_04955 [Alphaproteobacteria bacterium]|nr:hypothetical protein [Alphaproteobacteria bacterium]